MPPGTLGDLKGRQLAHIALKLMLSLVMNMYRIYPAGRSLCPHAPKGALGVGLVFQGYSLSSTWLAHLISTYRRMVP